MNIAFYIDVMNYRGIANSTFQYALYNKKILKNKSIIFYNNKTKENRKDVINKFKKKFKVIGISHFNKIDNFKKKLKLKFIYIQKGGDKKDNLVSSNIKTLVHAIFPQRFNQQHGYNYAYISEWISHKFSNRKIPYVPLIVQSHKTNKDLKKKLNINKKSLVLGCHGGKGSFDLKFVRDSIIKAVNKRSDLVFLFLNIGKFCVHPRVKFLKGTTNENIKKKFINTCDAMIYGRSLGESFGLACAEFAINDKLIISYKFNKHKSHQYNSDSKLFIEYSSFNSLTKILLKMKKGKRKNIFNRYKKCEPSKAIFLFKKIFLDNKSKNYFSFTDYFLNYISFWKMYYFYLRHKIYNHYYNFFESKIIDIKH